MGTTAESVRPRTARRGFQLLVYCVQFFFGAWFLYNGLNFFVTFFPQPSGSSPLSHELIGALIHSKLFAVVKSLEALTGIAFLANRWVPLATVLAFPISFSIAHLNIVANGDLFSIVTGVVVIALNAIIALGHLDRFLPMLAFNQGDPSVAGLGALFGCAAPEQRVPRARNGRGNHLRPWVHVLGILGGVAATAGFEGWTTSAHGPRSSAHYASVENASMTPQEVALTFERIAFTEHRPQEAVARLLGPSFVDHEAGGAHFGDRTAYLRHLTSVSTEVGAIRTAEHVVVEGDIVMVHYIRRDGAGTTAGVDIYRIAHRKIVEHWNVAQRLSPESAVTS
ncbi:MAG TPA: nuclear transport factor 2 family protein [Steroidobacteraceae bacterium]|nr:nuclear transport factor 2 family protein [Steroidobacteraceae bacterium]